MNMSLAHWLDQAPFVAILRGITPDEVIAVGDALYSEGWRVIEVPLNSPDAFASISRLQRHFNGRALVGAGTVRRHDDMERLVETGARLMVCPHVDQSLIAAARAAHLLTLPGAATPTECFQALDAGADGLKLFPADAVGTHMLGALRSVLPKGTPVLPVGGIHPDNLEPWARMGVAGFGIGSALYKPGTSAAQVQLVAQRFNAAWHALRERKLQD